MLQNGAALGIGSTNEQFIFFSILNISRTQMSCKRSFRSRDFTKEAAMSRGGAWIVSVRAYLLARV